MQKVKFYLPIRTVKNPHLCQYQQTMATIRLSFTKYSKILIFIIVLASGALFFNAEAKFPSRIINFINKEKSREIGTPKEYNSEINIEKVNVVLAGPVKNQDKTLPSPTQKPQTADQPEPRKNPKGVINKASTDKKIIALTFDADMTYGMERDLKSGKAKSWYNEDIISELKKTQTPATLFLTGLWIKNYPETTKELAANPLFELANHSYSHSGFTNPCYGLPPISNDMSGEEIAKTDDLLKEYAPNYKKYFRFPGLCHDDFDVAEAEKYGYKVIDGDVRGLDGFTHDAGGIISRVVSRTQSGSIIVLHMHGAPNAPETGNALPEIIRQLKEKGFTFVKISELLDSN